MKIIKYFLYFLVLFTLNLKAQTYWPKDQVENHIRSVARRNISEQHVYWKVEQLRQEPRGKPWCQSVCTAMLLPLMGIYHITPMDIENGTTGGTKPPAMSHIVNFLNKYRLPFMAGRFESAKSKPELVLEYAKDVIDKGSPPYILLNRHAYVLAGYNNKTQELYIIDPLRDKEILVYKYRNFNQWVANSQDYKNVKKVFLAHKIAQPKRFSYIVEPNAVSRLVFLKTYF
jgi:hypothetical protein